MQLTADVFGLPTARPHIYETSGLGAAIDAAVGLGLHPDFETAVREMTRLGRVFEPDLGQHQLYDAPVPPCLPADVPPAQAAATTRSGEITGYPARSE